MCRLTAAANFLARDVELDGNPIDPAEQHLQILHVKHDDAVGDPMMIPKPRNTFRILAKNPNGISIGDGGNLNVILDDLA